ncbi:putative effector [Erysiphe necator]|uniref:Putative effector n=1 Tax=Uncinula necator TaxID=52586 RepID=A0A0B1NZS4_UNCNE|nr:putative effector [Erysiphe necator]
MATTAKQGQWIAQVLRDMGYPQYIARNAMTVQTRGDNQGAIHLVKNPILSERSKHIDISYHFVRDLAEKKRIAVEYIPTKDMIADGMTKPLPRVSYEKFVRELGLGENKSDDSK